MYHADVLPNAPDFITCKAPLGAEAIAMRKPITVRVEPWLLAEARLCAIGDSRTLANLIETALRRRINGTAPEGPARRHTRTGHIDAA